MYMQLLVESKSTMAAVVEELPDSQSVKVNGSIITFNKIIRSICPPCLGSASNYGSHSYTCKNCFQQLSYLKIKLKAQDNAKYKNQKYRYGLKGMRKDFLTREELSQGITEEQNKRKTVEKESNIIVKEKLKIDEQSFLNFGKNENEEILLKNIVELIKSGEFERQKVHFEVLQNMVSKMKLKRRHRYSEIIQQISGLMKNYTGGTNHKLLSDLFGLASSTTITRQKKVAFLHPGVNFHMFDLAVDVYDGKPVIAASDEARTLRMLVPYKSPLDANIEIIGHAWSPDIDTWSSETVRIPRQNVEKGDIDDYDALKRLVNSNKHNLSKSTSIHNFVSTTSVNKNPLIYNIWPVPNSGYKAKHLLKVWSETTRLCLEYQDGQNRECPINLLGFSTDSAGFSLSAGNILMTPTAIEIQDGVLFLGLGLPDEQFVAPFYWKNPSIYFPDKEHLARLFYRNLKYNTRQLTMVTESKQTIICSIEHLKELRKNSKEAEKMMSSSDLEQLEYFDQNCVAAEKIFTPKIVQLLDNYVDGANGTSLYITAVTLLLNYDGSENTFENTIENVSCGIYVLRYWRKYIELKGLKLNSSAKAYCFAENRGAFITPGCYQASELFYSSCIMNILALYLISPNDLQNSLHSAGTGTITTERIIAQAQGKTTNIQSLDSQPTFADFLQRLTQVQENEKCLENLGQSGVNIPLSTNRRKHLQKVYKQNNVVTEKAVFLPTTYSAMQKKVIECHNNGISKAKQLIALYLPTTFINRLKEEGSWDCPYQYTHPKGIKFVNGNTPEGYFKLNKNIAEYKSVSIENTSNSKSKDKLDEDNSDNEDDKEDDRNQSYDSKPNSDVVGESINDNNEIDSIEDDNIDTDVTEDLPWYINRSVKGQTEKIHIRKAMSLLITREYISRDRRKRHIASKYLPGQEEVPETHDIIQFKDFAIRSGKTRIILARIIMIQDSDGKAITSCKKNSKSSFRARLYTISNSEVILVDKFILTNWLLCKNVIGPITLKFDGDKYVLNEESFNAIESWGYRIISDDILMQENITSEDLEIKEPGDGYFEMESIVERKLFPKDQTYRVKVRWKNYDEKADTWVPEAAFNQPITFTSVSSRGRIRKHKINDSKAEINSWEGQVSTKVKKKNNRKQNENASKTTESGSTENVGKMYDNKNNNKDNVQSRTELNSLMCLWGGKYGRQYLSNTCTIDHTLSSLYLIYQEMRSFNTNLSHQRESDPISGILHHMFQMVDGSDEQWTAARIHWIEAVHGGTVVELNGENPREQDKYSCFGTEEEMMFGYLKESVIGCVKGHVWKKCKNVKCRTRRHEIGRIDIVELLSRFTETDQNIIPLNDVLSEAFGRGCLTTCTKCRNMKCSVSYEVERLPFILHFWMHDYTEKLEYNKPEQFPVDIYIKNSRYHLKMLSIHKAGHFYAYILHQQTWWIYDPYTYRPNNKVVQDMSGGRDIIEGTINYALYYKIL